MALFELKQDYSFGVFPHPSGGETGGEIGIWPGSGGQAWKRPTFKDCAAADINLAFFNMDEFAEMHDIDGKDMMVVFEEDGLKEHSSHWEYGSKQSLDTGLYDALAVLYIRAADYGPRPKIGKRLVMDQKVRDKKRTYTIKSCEEEASVYRMTMERIQQ